MEPNDSGFQELFKKALVLMTGGTRNFLDSEAFMEEISKINKEMAEKYGQTISNVIVVFRPILAKIETETVDGNQPAEKSETIPPGISVGTPDDIKFLRELNITSGPEEVRELQVDFERARRGNDSVAPISSELAINRPSRLNDPRSPEEIIDSILGFAYKLDYDSRLFLASNINAAHGGLVPNFPEDEQLADDKFWLLRIKELAEALAGAEENKTALLNLEKLLEKIYKTQEGIT